MPAIPRSRIVLFFAIVLIGVALDLASKAWAFHRLGMPGAAREWIVPDVLGLETSLNQGALFGVGQGMVKVFAGLSTCAAAAVLAWVFLGGAIRDRWLTVALAGILAGILGNLYDRLGLPGLRWHDLHRMGEPVYAVRDWILVMIGPWHWPNFNVADSFLVCGAILLMAHAFWADPARSAPAGQLPGAEPTP